MKLNKYISKFSKAAVLAAAFTATSCMGDLDLKPIDQDISTPDKVFTSAEAFEQALAKVYAGFAVTGNRGPNESGDADVPGIDEGESSYWRLWFVMQEFTTDEAVNGWADKDLPTLSTNTWSTTNTFTRAFYLRGIYQVTLANEFIRQANNYGSGYDTTPAQIAEARFLRAMAYWHLMDVFGNGVPMLTEESPVGAFFPEPAGTDAKGPELFDFIESELLAIEGTLKGHSAAYVGQANKQAAQMMLAKLYLNHEVYLGSSYTGRKDYYALGKTKVDEVINSGLELMDANDVASGDAYTPYEYNFLADNHRAYDEIIFAITQDGLLQQTYGAMTFIINAATGSNVDQMGGGAWYGTRTTKALVNKFDGDDTRGLWYSEGHNLDIADQGIFTEGYAVMKFKNMTRDGQTGSNSAAGFVDTDVPVFRLADAFLMAAELDLRSGGSVSSANVDNINALRTRAGVDAVTSGDITLDWILDERARELYWEGHRRTDLLRHDKFTGGDYVWPLKGGSMEGTSISDHMKLMPLPPSDLNANPNLKQNAGY